jgi:hypothetical protein
MQNDATLRGLADLGFATARRTQPSEDVQRQQAEPPRVLMVAEIETQEGDSMWHRDTATTVTAPAGPITRVKREHILESFDPLDYEPMQRASIPVLHHHDRDQEIGQVEYLSFATDPKRILAVCSIDAAAADHWSQGESYISPGTGLNSSGRIVLDHLGLCRSTARIAAPAVKWAETTFDNRSRWTPQTVPGYALLVRAAEARRKRTQGAGIPIVGHPGFDEQFEEQRSAASRQADPLVPPYMRNNGEGGLFYSGGGGSVLRVW